MTNYDLYEREELIAEIQRLDALINTPHVVEFLESTRIEVAHQIGKWGTAHNRAKEPGDWFWLLAYLSGKALNAHINGDKQKALHHTISSAAVLANWHSAITQADNRMQPGSSDIEDYLQRVFGDTYTAVSSNHVTKR